jgi:hypothetical protein
MKKDFIFQALHLNGWFEEENMALLSLDGREDIFFILTLNVQRFKLIWKRFLVPKVRKKAASKGYEQTLPPLEN